MEAESPSSVTQTSHQLLTDVEKLPVALGGQVGGEVGTGVVAHSKQVTGLLVAKRRWRAAVAGSLMGGPAGDCCQRAPFNATC